MQTTLRAFVGLVLRPLRGAWNLLGVGLPGVIAAILWGLHHGLAAWILASATLIVCLAVAGYRLQGRVLEQENRRGFLNALGRKLTIGRHLLDSIEWEQEKFNNASENLTPEIPAEMEELETLLAEGSRGTIDWRHEVARLLDSRLDYSFVARFESNAGLVAAAPPTKLNVFADEWRDQEMRLQRLHQIIEELTDKWS
jgi:hypothetical protein